MENRICQNCKKDFIIEPDDFLFYEKIKVPPPTFCPECRMIRRLVWRNERSLKKRECGLCKKSIISMYADDGAPVYCSSCWESTSWDQFVNAREYSFDKPFFEQLREIFSINPRFYAYKFGSFVNSEFVNFAKDDKNAYLSYSVIECEDILYSTMIDKSRNCFDCFNVVNLDGCSYNVSCDSNYNTHYAVKSQNCIDSYFIYDCVNCQNCFMSSNLRNSQYFFKNQKLSKEEYVKILEEYKLNTYTGIEKMKREFDSLIKNQTFHKYGFIYASQNAIGDYIHNAKDVKNSFDTYESENVAYSFRVLFSKDCVDVSGVGYGEVIYEAMAATQNTFSDLFCYLTIQGCRECQYSMILKNCSNCFGCVGLSNAKYCILNKQYEEKEYFEMIEKIKKHMDDMPYVDKKGRVFKYGEFFPYDMSPFGYNETNANDFFSISKEEAVEKGYPWNEKQKKDYQVTISFENLPDDINDVSDNILSEVISCPNSGDQKTQCTSAFRITQDELQVYRQKKLPLPRYCPNCRHYERLKYRNPIKLWYRKCMKEGCNNDFETSYSAERSEIVYCEKCYQQEVY